MFHAPFLATAPGCDFVGVVTTSAERRASVVDDHPDVEVFSNLEELAGAGVEAVAISTPVDTHSSLCNQALRLGLHVVCDKPFANDAEAALATVELAEHLGLHLSPFQNRRWDSDFLTVRSIVDAGSLGEVTQFESSFERLDPSQGPGAAGGGTLLDFGSHLADQALVLLGPVDAVYADWRIRDTGLDDDVFVALRHTNGARSRLWGSWSQGAPGLRFRVTGANGAYVVDGPMDGQEDELLAGETPRSRGDRWGHEPEERWGRIRRGSDRRRSCRPFPARGTPTTPRSPRPCGEPEPSPCPLAMRSRPPECSMRRVAAPCRERCRSSTLRVERRGSTW